MAQGAFIVFRDEKDPRDIHFKLASEGNAPVPGDQLTLRDEIDKTLTVLRGIFPPNDQRFEEYFRPLLSLAQAGLVGNAAQPELAQRALMTLKEQIVAREAGRIKNQYMKRLGLRAVMLGAPALALAVGLSFLASWLETARSFLVLWSGCMAGVWLSFGARKTVLKFEELHIPEEDRLEPIVRLCFGGLLTVIIGLLFSTKAVVITLGSVESWHFVKNSELAVVHPANLDSQGLGF